MFITEFCGSWMDHPFSHTRFTLRDSDDLRRIRDSAVSHVWIDTAAGRDVTDDNAVTAAASSEEDAARQAESRLIEAVSTPATPEPVSLGDELARAAGICAMARESVTEMFGHARMGRTIDPAALDPVVAEISASVQRNPGALISLARLKSQDDYTYLHSVAVSALMLSLARQLGVDPGHHRDIALAGLLHDIGKAGVDLDILNKPGKLSDSEFSHMRQHPVAGHAMLVEGGNVSDIALDVCLHHHEKVDGTGYPDRLAGNAISLYAKMGAVCDVYDAITSDRPYKSGWDPATAIRKMQEWSAGHFDGVVFHAFVKAVGIYPVGSLVRLESGRLGVVCDLHENQLLQPVVRTFFCTRRERRLPVETLDLGAQGCDDRVVAWEKPANWPFDDLDELWRDGAGDNTSRAIA